MTLRDYQAKAVDEIRTLYAKGTKRVLLHLATGGGKTVVFSHILQSLHAKGKSGLMLVRGRELVDNGAGRLEREGVPHGIIMAGRKPTLGQQIYVCSVDTLHRRKLRPPADLIVIDEAHMACSESYKALIADYPNAFVLAVTATPYVDASMRHMADAVVAPIGIQGLIDQGWLVRPRYVVPVEQDLSSCRVENGDYRVADLAELMGRRSVIGDIGRVWGERARGRPTICFAPRVDNSVAIKDMMLGLGVRAEHVDADTPEPIRKRVMADLCEGRLDLVTNVGILCTGVDIPPVSCILMARPTKSLNLYIQQAGRGTRPYPGKTDFLILDHANNVREHGFITDAHEVFLDETPKTKGGAAPIKICRECYAALPVSSRTCPECGYEFVPEEQDDSRDGELEEIEDSLDVRAKSRLKELKRVAKAKGYKRGWIFHVMKAEFGEVIANSLVPKREVPAWVQMKIGR